MMAPLANARRQAQCVARHVVAATMGAPDPVIDLDAGAGVVTDAVLGECGATPVCVEDDGALAAGLAERGYPVRALADLPDGVAQTLYSIHGLAHAPDPAARLALALRKCARGARVLVYLPAHPRLLGTRPILGRRVTRAWLVTTLRDAGVRVERSGYTDSVGLVLDAGLHMARGRIGVTARRARWYDRWGYPLSHMADRLLGGRLGANVWAQGVCA